MNETPPVSEDLAEEVSPAMVALPAGSPECPRKPTELPSRVSWTGLPPTPLISAFLPPPPGAAARECEREAPQVGGRWVDRHGDRCQQGGGWEDGENTSLLDGGYWRCFFSLQAVPEI